MPVLNIVWTNEITDCSKPEQNPVTRLIRSALSAKKEPHNYFNRLGIIFNMFFLSVRFISLLKNTTRLNLCKSAHIITHLLKVHNVFCIVVHFLFLVLCVDEKTRSVLICFSHARHTLFFSMHMPLSVECVSWGLIERLWSKRSPAHWKFKLPADLCKLHLVQGHYKLGPHSPCDVNRMKVAKKCRVLEMCPTKVEVVHYLITLHEAQTKRNGRHAPALISS